VNASIPPTPSFYPEALIVLSLRATNFKRVVMFVLLRFFVCYYNTFLFLCYSQSKSTTIIAYTKVEKPEALGLVFNNTNSFICIMLLILL